MPGAGGGGGGGGGPTGLIIASESARSAITGAGMRVPVNTMSAVFASCAAASVDPTTGVSTADLAQETSNITATASPAARCWRLIEILPLQGAPHCPPLTLTRL